ncbi:MAG: acetolactate synthase small subunit [Gammaproteobacteria bacterium]|nr:acetolactate synthase small subunit [Gammaproteobacteria bacterium]
MNSPEQRHTISILLENETGALCRVSGLFAARAYNIETLTVAPTEDPSVARMTLVTCGSPQIVEQIIKQLNKLVDVIRLIDLNEGPHIERELMLVKLDAGPAEREEIKRLVDIFRAKIIDVTDKNYIVELTGHNDKLEAFLNAIDRRLIVEVVRSGALGILRGGKSLRV